MKIFKQNKLRALALTIFVLLQASVVRSEALFFGTIEDNLLKGLTAVEVLGTLKGSGVLVLLDGSPVILTNSHNLQGLQVAKITLPVRKERFLSHLETKHVYLGFSGVGKVLIDHPVLDFAIISLPENIKSEDLNIIKLYAELNGSFSSGKNSKGWTATDHKLRGSNYVTAVLDGKSFSVEVVAGEKVEAKKSFFEVPVYTRPGVSGGAFYYNGKLAGLVARVSLSGEALTEAIPMKLISEALRERTDTATWVNGEFHFQDEQDSIIIRSGKNGGAETGHGGAETGHGGAETGHGGAETGHGGDAGSVYLDLRVMDANGAHSVKTWNPFFPRESSFWLNGQKVFAFESKGKLKAPDFADYIAHKKTLKPIFHSAALKQSIIKTRSETLANLRFGRLYRFSKAEKAYEVESFFTSTYVTYGVQDLLKKPADFPFLNQSLDSNFFKFGFFRPSDLLEGSADLQRITFMNEILELQPMTSATSLRYKSKEGSRAVYFFDPQDLKKLERIMIIKGDDLIELWP